MRPKSSDKLLASLEKLRRAVELYSDPQLRSAVIKELDQLVRALSDIRARLTSASVPERISATIAALQEVVEFLERAKSDEVLQMAFSEMRTTRARQTRRASIKEPIEIAPNLTNQQIRELLQRELSKAELAEIAKQRSISVGKRTKNDLRAAILDFIERQEGYERLHA